MNSTELKKLLNLSRKEKIKLVQTLWDNIASEQNAVSFPAEHAEYLEKRIERITSGKTKFKNWNDVKKKYLESTNL